MPKEIIKHPTPAQDGEVRFDCVVGWTRDMDVQVGIQTSPRSDGEYHLIDVIYGDQLRDIGYAVRQRRDTVAATKPDELATSDEELGRIVLDAVTGSTPFGTGVFWHPTREQINHLIRTLRKARDQAFGQDA